MNSQKLTKTQIETLAQATHALSIRQPWAWLIVNGYKDVENRSWATKRRGPIWIHAGKKIEKGSIEWVRSEFPSIPLPESFDTGGFVGCTKITDCVQVSGSRWFFGEYGFLMQESFPIPLVPSKGQLSFYRVSDADIESIAASIGQ